MSPILHSSILKTAQCSNRKPEIPCNTKYTPLAEKNLAGGKSTRGFSLPHYIFTGLPWLLKKIFLQADTQASSMQILSYLWPKFS